MYCDVITQPLPETVLIEGVSYPINWDFRMGIQFEKIIRSDLSEEEKLKRMLTMYYPRIPHNLTKAVEQIMLFYRCGEPLQEEDNTKQRYRRRKSGEPECVFSQDAPYIYAAFREQYGIDLTTVESLHWWKFMALFESLGDDTKISKIMYYRKVSTTGMSKERRAFVNEMKKLYKIRNDGVKKITLEQRNQNWKNYVKERLERG